MVPIANENAKEEELSFNAVKNEKWHTDIWQFHIKLNMFLLNNPVKSCSWFEKLCPFKNLHYMFIAALFTSHQKLKQSRCPSIDVQTNCSTPAQ